MIEDKDDEDDGGKFASLIDDNLKRVYADMTAEELPSTLKDLLAQLKAQDMDGKTRK